ncbi:MAG: hypothetical protein RIR11_3388 [Bacteroidota bacterium]|jgi:hypothetical protein
MIMQSLKLSLLVLWLLATFTSHAQEGRVLMTKYLNILRCYCVNNFSFTKTIIRYVYAVFKIFAACSIAARRL